MNKMPELSIRIKYTNDDGETVFINRDAAVSNKNEAKALLRAAWKTYRSSLDVKSVAICNMDDEEKEWLDSAGIPRWL